MYYLKTKLMEKVINSRKKKNPFNYKKAESFEISEKDDKTINNSYYFSACDPLKKESLYLRLGNRGENISEVWFYYKNELEEYTYEKLYFYNEEVPLKVFKKDGIWNISFGGLLKNNNGENIDAKFIGKFEGNNNPIDFFSNMPSIRTAKAMSLDKWSKEFFEEIQKNNQVHYEEVGKLKGILRLGNSEKEINLNCCRDHSFGKRLRSYMNNHLWLMAINDTKELNFSMVSYPSMSLLEVGNYFSSKEQVNYVLGIEYDRESLFKDGIKKNFEMKLRLDNKEELKVLVNLENTTKYDFEDKKYSLFEGIASFEINGEKFRGIYEIGFNEDRSRLFNGLDLKRAK